MTKPPEQPPAIVPMAQQAGSTRASWRWINRCVWTLRMLTVLLTRVEGMKWFRLYDKVFLERNLLSAFQQVARKKGAAGVDHVTVEEFERRLPDSVWELSDQLKSKTYRPQAVRRVHIPKPGTNETRPLGIPSVGTRSNLGCRKRADIASDENEDRGLTYGEFFLLGVYVSGGRLRSTGQKYQEAEGVRPLLRLLRWWQLPDHIDEDSATVPGFPDNLNDLIYGFFIRPARHLVSE